MSVGPQIQIYEEGNVITNHNCQYICHNCTDLPCLECNYSNLCIDVNKNTVVRLVDFDKHQFGCLMLLYSDNQKFHCVLTNRPTDYNQIPKEYMSLEMIEDQKDVIIIMIVY